MGDNQIAQKSSGSPHRGRNLPSFEPRRSYRRLLPLGFLCQLDASGVQFGSDFSNLFGVDFGRQFFLKALQRSGPLRDGFFGLAKLQINIAQVIMHGGIRVQMAACFDEASLGIGQLALAEIHPAQTVQVGAVIRLQIAGFLDELIGFIQPEVAVRQCVSQIVQRSGMLRVEGQHFAEGAFGLVVLLHALEHGAAHEKDALFVFVGGGEFFGLIQGLAHVLEAFALFVNLGRRQERLKITRAIHEPAEFAGGIIGLAQVAKHLGVLAGNYVLVVKLFQGGFGFALGAGQILRRAVGLDDLHGHHLGAVFEDGAHLFVGVQRLRVVAGSAVQIAANGGAILFFFHGGTWLPEVAAARNKVAVVTLQAGSGSASYTRLFDDPGRFPALLKEAEGKAGVRFGRVMLGGWSAGCGAIRQILQAPDSYARVAGALMIDGIHTDYVDGKPGPGESKIGGETLEIWQQLARDAIAGRKRIIVTHSEIFPGTFASTTETADYLLKQLDLTRRPVLKWGPMGLQQLSEVRAGKFLLMGYAGNSAPDHVDQLQSLPVYLKWLR